MEPAAMSFDSPDGPVVLVRVIDGHAWRNFDPVTMQPISLNPLPYVSAALAKDGYHAEVCFTPAEDEYRLTISFLNEDKSRQNYEVLKRDTSNLLLTYADLRARADVLEDWQIAHAAWHAREAQQRKLLRDTVPAAKLATYDAWCVACREIVTLRVGGLATGRYLSAKRGLTRRRDAEAAHSAIR
jgi:hypothetical protein